MPPKKTNKLTTHGQTVFLWYLEYGLLQSLGQAFLFDCLWLCRAGGYLYVHELGLRIFFCLHDVNKKNQTELDVLKKTMI